MPEPRRLGTDYEDRAADYLAAKGYTVVTRRYKAKHGELDVIALDGDTLVFVEVRHRSWIPAEESISDKKIAHIQRAAAEYLIATEQEAREYRFDVIAFGRDAVRHHVDVFRD